MSLRKETPCDFGQCPYDAEYSYTCDYYCSEEEPEEDFGFYREGIKMRFLRDNEPFSFDEDSALFETAVTYMSDDIREELHRELAPCKPDKFMIAYCLKDLGFIEFLEREFGITVEWSM